MSVFFFCYEGILKAEKLGETVYGLQLCYNNCLCILLQIHSYYKGGRKNDRFSKCDYVFSWF